MVGAKGGSRVPSPRVRSAPAFPRGAGLREERTDRGGERPPRCLPPPFAASQGLPTRQGASVRLPAGPCPLRTLAAARGSCVRSGCPAVPGEDAHAGCSFLAPVCKLGSPEGKRCVRLCSPCFSFSRCQERPRLVSQTAWGSP